MVVGTNTDGGSYALAVDDDGGLGGFAWRDWLCIGVVESRIDLAEDATLHGSGSLLLRIPPSVLDLDQLRSRSDFAVDMRRQFDLVAIPVKTLVALNVTEE